MKRLRILVSAYACEPDRGSEPAVGWNFVLQIARFQDVWVITRANNRSAIEGAARDLASVHWVYYDLPRWMRFWKKGPRGVHLYYYLWQIGCYRLARRLHGRIGFDVAHHVTFVNYWMPSFLALLPIPFIWGPVGGGESCPLSFWKTFGLRGIVFEVARSAARWIGQQDPFVRLCARRASFALATTPETAVRLRQLGCRAVRLLTAVGMGRHEPGIPRAQLRRPQAALRLGSVGRLVHLKGYHLSLQAFALLFWKLPGCTYRLIGDGPERARLEALVRRLGISSSVHFAGTLPRRQVLKAFSEFDVLVHPSLHDSGGLACLEAMAGGLPVICLDLGGPAILVSQESGIRVPAHRPRDAVAALAEAISLLAADQSLLDRMGKAASRRVAGEFSWEGKGEYLRRLYETLDARG